jgi:transcriptional regulator with XRE-family HTH domain
MAFMTLVYIIEAFMIALLTSRARGMMSLRDILASNLKKYRRISGVSQAKLAEKADITTQYIAMIEVSRKFPSPEMLDRIAGALGIEAYQLFEAPPSPENALERLHQDIRGDMKQLFEAFLKEIRSAQCGD